MPVDRFGAVATALSVGRDGLTIFAHASTGDDFADHGRNMIWFGPSEALNLAIFEHKPSTPELINGLTDRDRAAMIAAMSCAAILSAHVPSGQWWRAYSLAAARWRGW